MSDSGNDIEEEPSSHTSGQFQGGSGEDPSSHTNEQFQGGSGECGHRNSAGISCTESGTCRRTSSFRQSIPAGFDGVMDMIIREVMSTRPCRLFEFIADRLEAEMIRRDLHNIQHRSLLRALQPGIEEGDLDAHLCCHGTAEAKAGMKMKPKPAANSLSGSNKEIPLEAAGDATFGDATKQNSSDQESHASYEEKAAVVVDAVLALAISASKEDISFQPVHGTQGATEISDYPQLTLKESSTDKVKSNQPARGPSAGSESSSVLPEFTDQSSDDEVLPKVGSDTPTLSFGQAPLLGKPAQPEIGQFGVPDSTSNVYGTAEALYSEEDKLPVFADKLSTDDDLPVFSDDISSSKMQSATDEIKVVKESSKDAIKSVNKSSRDENKAVKESPGDERKSVRKSLKDNVKSNQPARGSSVGSESSSVLPEFTDQSSDDEVLPKVGSDTPTLSFGQAPLLGKPAQSDIWQFGVPDSTSNVYGTGEALYCGEDKLPVFADESPTDEDLPVFSDVTPAC